MRARHVLLAAVALLVAVCAVLWARVILAARRVHTPVNGQAEPVIRLDPEPSVEEWRAPR